MDHPVDGTIKSQMLKLRSGEFDLGSIHSLILKNLDITDLGCLGECTHLVRLDLSYNDICKLYQLGSLVNLQFLNISANRIVHLEGLQNLENLNYLNMAGNLVGNMESLRCICGLDKLEEIRLNDNIKGLSNPVYNNGNYRSIMIEMFPNLKIIDGEHLGGKGSELFKLCDTLDKDIEDGSLKNGPMKEVPKQSSWINPGMLTMRENTWVDKKSQNAEDHIKEVFTECQELCSKADESLKNMKELLHFQPST